MAGGPIAIADQPGTIGDNLKYYTNDEMLALNQDRFVGKPIWDEVNSEGSNIWYGQMSNGDYVLGLFNREDTPKGFNIAFSDLGINGSMNVRDLWEHTDEGTDNEKTLVTLFAAIISACAASAQTSLMEVEDLYMVGDPTAWSFLQLIKSSDHVWF